MQLETRSFGLVQQQLGEEMRRIGGGVEDWLVDRREDKWVDLPFLGGEIDPSAIDECCLDHTPPHLDRCEVKCVPLPGLIEKKNFPATATPEDFL
jgi:hypothetical protein